MNAYIELLLTSPRCFSRYLAQLPLHTSPVLHVSSIRNWGSGAELLEGSEPEALKRRLTSLNGWAPSYVSVLAENEVVPEEKWCY